MYIFFLTILDWTEYDGVINLEQIHVHVHFILKCLDSFFSMNNGSFNGKEHIAGCS